jgi:hypothetical protein
MASDEEQWQKHYNQASKKEFVLLSHWLSHLEKLPSAVCFPLPEISIAERKVEIVRISVEL